MREMLSENIKEFVKCFLFTYLLLHMQTSLRIKSIPLISIEDFYSFIPFVIYASSLDKPLGRTARGGGWDLEFVFITLKFTFTLSRDSFLTGRFQATHALHQEVTQKTLPVHFVFLISYTSKTSSY